MASKYVLLVLSLLSASMQPSDAELAPVQIGTDKAVAEVVATVTLPATPRRPKKTGPAAEEYKSIPMWEGGTQTAWISAYSSTPDQTDDTPFITASGKYVADGIVATNHLPFGTKVQIPEVFGDKTFVVEDRMHPRKVGFLDVWMPTREAALKFGVTHAEVVVVQD